MEPIGQLRADYHHGILCAHLTNLFNSVFSEEGRTPTASDPIIYIPWLERDREFGQEKEMKELSEEDQLDKIKEQMHAFMGTG